MTNYRRGAHSVFKIHVHLVWVTKYRRAVLSGEVGLRVRDLVRQICGDEDVTILKGHVSRDHVHLFLSVPPQVAVSKLVQKLKGKTARKLLDEFRHLRKTFWGRHVWARGYFCCSAGNVTDEMVAEYIAKQDMDRDDDFRVEGEAAPKGSPPPT